MDSFDSDDSFESNWSSDKKCKKKNKSFESNWSSGKSFETNWSSKSSSSSSSSESESSSKLFPKPNKKKTKKKCKKDIFVIDNPVLFSSRTTFEDCMHLPKGISISKLFGLPNISVEDKIKFNEYVEVKECISTPVLLTNRIKGKHRIKFESPVDFSDSTLVLDCIKPCDECVVFDGDVDVMGCLIVDGIGGPKGVVSFSNTVIEACQINQCDGNGVTIQNLNACNAKLENITSCSDSINILSSLIVSGSIKVNNISANGNSNISFPDPISLNVITSPTSNLFVNSNLNINYPYSLNAANYDLTNQSLGSGASLLGSDAGPGGNVRTFKSISSSTLSISESDNTVYIDSLIFEASLPSVLNVAKTIPPMYWFDLVSLVGSELKVVTISILFNMLEAVNNQVRFILIRLINEGDVVSTFTQPVVEINELMKVNITMHSKDKLSSPRVQFKHDGSVDWKVTGDVEYWYN